MEREIRGMPEELKILIGRLAIQPEETLLGITVMVWTALC